MVLANAAYFAYASVMPLLWLLYALLIVHHLNYTVDWFFFNIWTAIMMPIGVLVGGGVFATVRDGDSSERPAVN
jgi:hypothetical protein